MVIKKNYYFIFPIFNTRSDVTQIIFNYYIEQVNIFSKYFPNDYSFFDFV